MENNSHLTAITRTKPSLPTRMLLDRNLVKGTVLDYGCGKGFDVSHLKGLGFDATGYDPYFFPDKPDGTFTTIICNYVLNVLEKERWNSVLDEIASHLDEQGAAYIAVRRGIRKEGYRKHVGGCTYQANVVLDLDVLLENSKFCIYVMTKEKRPGTIS